MAMKPDRSDYLEQQLSAYLDGEVTDAERAEVEAYLAASEDARRVFEDLRRNAELLRSLPRAKAPDGLPELVTAELERRELLGEEPLGEPGSRPAARGAGRWLASAAVIVLAASAGLLTFTHLRQGSPRRAPAPLGPIADVRDGSSGAARDEMRDARPAEPAAEQNGAGGGHEGGGAGSMLRMTTPTVSGTGGSVHSVGDFAVTNGVAQEGAGERTYPERGRQEFAERGGRQDGGIAAKGIAGVPRKRGPTLAEAPPAADHTRSTGGGVTADAALAREESRHIADALDRCLGVVVDQISTASSAPVARDHTLAKAGTFEISLVYADQEAKDAAVGLIKDTLSRSPAIRSAEASAAASAPTSRPGEPAHPEVCFSYVVMPSAPDSRDSAIMVDATPETASIVLSAIEDVGCRIAPVSVSVEQGAASGWSAVQSLGQAYVARCAGSPGDSAGASVASLTNSTGEVTWIASSGSAPASLHDSVVSLGVQPAAAVPASSRSSEALGYRAETQPTLSASYARAMTPAPGTVPTPAAVPAPASDRDFQASAPQTVAAAKANAPVQSRRTGHTVALPTPRQSQERFEPPSVQPAAGKERLQLLLRLLVAPEAAPGSDGATPTTHPATSSTTRSAGP